MIIVDTRMRVSFFSMSHYDFKNIQTNSKLYNYESIHIIIR